MSATLLSPSSTPIAPPGTLRLSRADVDLLLDKLNSLPLERRLQFAHAILSGGQWTFRFSECLDLPSTGI